VKYLTDHNVISYCVLHLEAQYAYNKRKPIIALRLEADYEPEDWLGPLCINNLFYDFSDQQSFDNEWPKLQAQLKQLTGTGCDVGFSCYDVVFIKVTINNKQQ